MTAHAQRAHARLSPSASKRWLSCPGSVRMSDGIPNVSTRFADEGTAAHELAQHCLATGFDTDRFADMFVNLDGQEPSSKFIAAETGDRCHLIDAEMVDGVQTYLDFVRDVMQSPGVEFEVEQWLSLEYLGIAGLDGGTGDVVAYHPESQILDVVDLKYGRGVPVHPRENTQGLNYALGAIRRYHNRGIRKLRISIVQPRCPQPGDDPAPGIRTWEADVIDLLDFEAELIEGAKRTIEAAAQFEHVVDFNAGPGLHEWGEAYLKAGEWCKFCPAAAVCPARRESALQIAQAEFSVVGDDITLPVVTQMKPEDLAKVLAEVNQLEDWCRRVKEHAHAEAVHGRGPPGFKLVAKRATRRWRDEDVAQAALEAAGLADEDMFAPRELLSPAKIEPKMPGRNKAARAEALSALIVKESSGTVLAPESDPRPAVRADASEFGAADD